jgi:hypothetical protein
MPKIASPISARIMTAHPGRAGPYKQLQVPRVLKSIPLLPTKSGPGP